MIRATLIAVLFAGPLWAEEDPGAAWRLIASVEVREEVEGNAYKAVKTYPDALMEAASQPFTIQGYYVPVEAQAYVTTFLVVEDPADCPYCGSNSGYGPALEVHMSKPMPDLPEASLIRVQGRLVLNRDPETFQALVMRDAVLITP